MHQPSLEVGTGKELEKKEKLTWLTAKPGGCALHNVDGKYVT